MHVMIPEAAAMFPVAELHSNIIAASNHVAMAQTTLLLP